MLEVKKVIYFSSLDVFCLKEEFSNEEIEVSCGDFLGNCWEIYVLKVNNHFGYLVTDGEGFDNNVTIPSLKEINFSKKLPRFGD